MKEVWSDNSLHIRAEFHEAIEKRNPFAVYRENFPLQTVFAKTLVERKSVLLLYFDKAEPFKAYNELAFFFYRPNNFATRGFYGTPLEETVDSLCVLFPHEIVQFQRRRSRHMETPEESTAQFALQSAHKSQRAAVINVSLGGALLSGIFPPLVKTGARISDLSLSLYMMNPRVAPAEVEFPQAEVVREINLKGGGKKVAVAFSADGREKEKLENYIDLRLMEKKFTSREWE